MAGMGRSSGAEGGGREGGEADGGGISDCSPGTIVWVRRRNGSWWPGRILGSDELRASQVVSPKTGTPVKLLGRDDASVDWYNLEKSKRVKEFRCGDFDACIEKAMAMSCQGTPVKRREKYARREDAILHALKLESKQLASKYQNPGFRSDDISSIPFADMGREFDNFASEHFSRNNVQQPQLNLQSSATQQCKYLSTTRYKSKKKQKGDNSVILGKTKEYEQSIHVSSKRKFSGSLAGEASENTLSNHDNGFSGLRHMQGESIIENGGENVALKKERSGKGLFEGSIVKKYDRCRPLAQAVQNGVKSFQHNDNSEAVLVEKGKDSLPAICSTKRSGDKYLSADCDDGHTHPDIPDMHDSFSGEQPVPDFVEKHGSDFSVSECSETETEDDAELLQRYTKRQSPELDACDPNSLQAPSKLRHVNDNNDDDELTFSTYMPRQNGLEDEDGSSELGVSKWHMKGKRNQRSAARRPVGKADENLSLDKSSSLMEGSWKMAYEGDSKIGSIGASSRQSFGQSFSEDQELDCDSDGTNLIDKATNYSELNRYHGKDYPDKPSLLNQNSDQVPSLGQKAYQEGSSSYQRNCGPRLGYMGTTLFDVELKVQAIYQGERVPLVSLMNMNRKAIVGHPIQIELLEDGSTDHFVLGSDIVLGHSTGAAPAWRKGRRTAMPRVPRSNSSRATLDSDAAPSNEQLGLAKNISSSGRPFSQKSRKKPSNFKEGSSPSQKIRILSSIPIAKRRLRECGLAKAHRSSNILGGLIEPEGAIPLVTCVPAKVVFSRIMEAVGRPSHALAHRV